MTLRNLPDEVHDRLRAQAKSNNRSLEAEVRSILMHSAIAASDGGFGRRLRARYGAYLGGDLTIAREDTATPSDLFE